MDTNANESLNNGTPHFTPKNREHCSTRSLQSRVAMAVGITDIGFPTHFQRLFAALGIHMTTSVLHCLKAEHQSRKRRLAKRKETKTKKLCNKTKFAAQKEQEDVAKKERNNGEGMCSPGAHMLEESFDGMMQPKWKTKVRVCPLCAKKGHSTKKSEKCMCNLQHKDFDPNRPIPVPPSEAFLAPCSICNALAHLQWNIIRH